MSHRSTADLEKFTLEVGLKSGHTLTFRVTDYEFTFNNLTGGYSGYSFKGLDDKISMAPDQICYWRVIKRG
jgi:hypothetical protein